MNNRKSYNSIFFLTVYLGLVLVGASPQVLAHAATNSLFDLRNEIEYKDDLDKKPENDEVEDFLALESEKAIGEFINELKKLKKSGKRISNRQIEKSCAHTWVSDDSSGMASIIASPESSNVSSVLDKLWNHYEKLLANSRYDNLPSYFKYLDSKVEFSQKHSFQNRNLDVQIHFSHDSVEKAKSFADNLNESFAKEASQAKNKVTKVVYENTKAISSSGYVSVTTNLPRSSIDSLLKH